MSNTSDIYAYRFPEDDFYTSIFNDKSINAKVFTDIKTLLDKSIKENDVIFIYFSAFEDNVVDLLDILKRKHKDNPIVAIGERYNQEYLEGIFEHHYFTYLNFPCSREKVIEILLNAKNKDTFHKPDIDLEAELNNAQKKLIVLNNVAIALTTQKNIGHLLNFILTKTRHLLKADAGSLYLKEGEKNLRFVFTQNISTNWSGEKDILLEINDKSISGFTAKTGHTLNILDVYFVPPTFPFSFNQDFDKSTGYRTKSMITAPMYNKNGEIVGVIQLMNKRKDYEGCKKGIKLEEENIIPFNNEDVDLLNNFASQAAVALQNAKLLYDLRRTFEGFVKASVVAIEAKDPCTHGHSERVAELTVALAKTINDIHEGTFANLSFNEKELLQIRYASLLHDFGKVSISDEILTKSKKLFPYELENLIARYKFIKKSIETDYYKNCYDYISKNGYDKFLSVKQEMENNFNKQINEIENAINTLVKSNEPTVLEEDSSNKISELAKSEYTDGDGNKTAYLTERESTALSVKRGSLTEQERLEIESHVKHSYNFLSKIPWGKDLARVPEIAYAHHEKLNGKGYPRHSVEKDIPIESQMMGIADIFDALTAQDRPYKPALPLKKALDILSKEAENNALNKELVDIFEKYEVYKCLEEKN